MKFTALLMLATLAIPSVAFSKIDDADKDGVSDMMDKCPLTPGNSAVNAYGCRKGERVVLSVDVNFATNSDIVGQQYRYQVQNLADFMKANPGIGVEIKGYADPRGSAAHNKDLAMQRAEAIKKMLVEDYAITSSRVQAVGLGETARVTPHKGAEGNYRNRRVEARIIE